MANTLSIDQIGVLVQSIAEQATGHAVMAPKNTKEFVAVAQTALLSGTEQVMNAMSQLLSRTIYARRNAYNAALDILVTDEQGYGNHVRKINAIDTAFEEDPHYNLVDGASIDMYKIRKPKILQTNFYGAQTFLKSITIFEDQVNTALSGPDEFQRFLGLALGNMQDQIEQVLEEMARATIANFIAAKTITDSRNVIHLLTLYNSETDLSLTAQTVKQPANYGPFIQWVYGKMQVFSDRLTERTVLNHVNLTGYPIPRHTPAEDQRLVLYSADMAMINAAALPGIFHESDLKLPRRYEAVSYWQSPEDGNRDEISVLPSYIDASGAVVNAGTATELDNVFGVLYDRDAMGVTRVHQRTYRTPFNTTGEYSNVDHHFTCRWWNDLTENAFVFMMD